jgi:serine/threonine protein kinase
VVGQTLSHYRILEQIGAGGMGIVYRAHDERLDRDVALKVLPPGALAERDRKRFRKEALALSRLNHPNIATVYDFDTQDGVDFLVMEHIAGVTLDRKLVEGALPEREISRLGVQLAEGLAAAHQQGVVHRDLKPGNLIVTDDRRLKILDFGLAKLLRPVSETAVSVTLTETQAAAGTLPYMPPEQLRVENVDARSDIWAAGTVLYEMATGRRAFRERIASKLTDAILHQAPEPVPCWGQHGARLTNHLISVVFTSVRSCEVIYSRSAQLRSWSSWCGVNERQLRCQFWCQFVLRFRAWCCKMVQEAKSLTACIYKTMHSDALRCTANR